jgi:hypothetical protein
MLFDITLQQSDTQKGLKPKIYASILSICL